MAEMEDLIKQIELLERLEKENKRLTIQLKIANKEIDKCHIAIDRYEQMIDDESKHFSRLAEDLKRYSDNIQKLYEQGK